MYLECVDKEISQLELLRQLIRRLQLARRQHQCSLPIYKNVNYLLPEMDCIPPKTAADRSSKQVLNKQFVMH